MSRRSRIFTACLGRAIPRGNTIRTTKSNAVAACHVHAGTAYLHFQPAVTLPPCVADFRPAVILPSCVADFQPAVILRRALSTP
jgi:hypothetical protein